MREINSGEMTMVSGGDASGETFVGAAGYYVGSEVAAGFCEGLEVGAAAGPVGAIAGAVVGAALVALWDAT